MGKSRTIKRAENHPKAFRKLLEELTRLPWSIEYGRASLLVTVGYPTGKRHLRQDLAECWGLLNVSLLKPQRLNWIQRGRLASRIVTEQDAYDGGEDN